ncbi:MAG: tetratricopeptide repeat protein [Planctomycetota bacterium]|jgi:serine/threonine protein kinase/Tfp pilus assembly protein PilF
MSDTGRKNGGQPVKSGSETTVVSGGLAERVGGQIGPYKLLSVLGEGGFAVVYLAEQEHPVKRRVALKIIKPGMDSKEVIARFEAERQALALLDHPNIARVFDAGTTGEGHPYFIMEHVNGVSITEYCDSNKLSISDRLGLFLKVCEAVQHAHQKGIIHRDIKPSNILVAPQEDVGVPKIIDFGIAKAIVQPLTERTLFTEKGQLVGTPEYMSPEQVQMSVHDIDTRSDIYSLGVLLYELLTGVMPFDPDKLREGGVDDLRRIIREQDPKTPSTRLTGLGDTAQRMAESRGTNVVTLARRLHEELEWIPLKAMRKDRARRYRSASELADDIRNYLNGVPLIAGPESRIYRLKKFVGRNRMLVTSATAILVVLVAAVIVSTAFAIKEAQARADALAAGQEAERQARISQAVSDFLRDDLLSSVDPYVAPAREVSVRSFLDAASQKLEGKFEQEPLVEASIRHTLGNTYRNIGEFENAQMHLDRARKIRLDQLGELNAETLSTVDGLARVYWRQGQYDQAQSLFITAVKGREQTLGLEHAETLFSMDGLAVLYFSQGRYDEAESLYGKMLEISRAALGEENVATLLFMGNLATVYRFQGRYDEAEPLYEKAVEHERRILGAEHPDTLYSVNGLAMLCIAWGRYDKAEELLLDVIEVGSLVFGAEHPDVLESTNGLGLLRIAQGNYDEAEKLLADAFRTATVSLGLEHPSTLTSVNHLARLYMKKALYDKSESLFDMALQARRRVLGEEHPDTLRSAHGLGMLYATTGRLGEAEQLLKKTLASRRRVLREKHPDIVDSIKDLIQLYWVWSKPQEASQWQAELARLTDSQ